MWPKIVVLMVAMWSMAASAQVVYVDSGAGGGEDGSSWADAYKYLQDALASASSGDEVRVAQGLYRPDDGAGIVEGDREASFALKNGVAVKGGYAGLGEADPERRNIGLYVTVLSVVVPSAKGSLVFRYVPLFRAAHPLRLNVVNVDVLVCAADEAYQVLACRVAGDGHRFTHFSNSSARSMIPFAFSSGVPMPCCSDIAAALMQV